MSGFYDIYVLAGERSASVIDRFLDRFAPKREASAEDFEVYDTPPDSEPLVFDDITLAIDYCVAHRTADAGLYWRLLSPPPEHAMAFFRNDGNLILGLSTSAEPSVLLDELRAFVGDGVPGYICVEEPPPDTTAEFLSRALNSSWPPGS